MNESHRLTNAVVAVQGLGKAYSVLDSPRDRLRTLLTGRENGAKSWALRDVSFALRRGQSLGLVGNNGAGKSTLLKLLAGSLKPTTGSVKVVGRLTAILELGAGFHPDFTGRENLYFGGSVIGIPPTEIDRLLPSIIEFSELSTALDRPVKTYSSGMAVRLAFSLVTSIEPDVLIIDEALAVGDQQFQKKCVDRINRFRENGCTILFCSHSIYHIRQLCDVAIWIENGEARAFGPTERVLTQYDSFMQKRIQMEVSKIIRPHDSGGKESETSLPTIGKQAELIEFRVEGMDGDVKPKLTTPDLVVSMKARSQNGEMLNFGVMLEQANGRGITSVTTHTDSVTPKKNKEGEYEITLTFTDLPLFSGEYVLSAYLFDETGLVVYEEWLRCKYFHVSYASMLPGLVQLPHYWR